MNDYYEPKNTVNETVVQDHADEIQEKAYRRTPSGPMRAIFEHVARLELELQAARKRLGDI